jgi:hypothetical protein
MVLASGVRRFRVLGVICIALIAFASALAFAAKPTKADTRVVTGGESRLEVSVANFVKLLGDGIFITPIAPARLEFGAEPAAIFPVGSPLGNLGVADAVLKTATVPHQGGLRITKDSIGQSIDATNVTLACLPVAGCHVLNTANNLLPNELAEVRDFTFTDDGNGTVNVRGFAYINAVTALTLNTLFQSTVFFDGMQLGAFNTTLTY